MPATASADAIERMPDGDPDMSYVINTVQQIRARLRRGQLAVLESTTYPGTTDELVRSIILAEADRFFVALAGTVAAHTTAEERVIEGFAFALEYLRGHLLFQRLLRTEPEALLPHLVRDNNLILVARATVAALIADERMSARDAEPIAELLARLVLSLALNPDSALGADDQASARRLARRYLVPALRAG